MFCLIGKNKYGTKDPRFNGLKVVTRIQDSFMGQPPIGNGRILSRGYVMLMVFGNLRKLPLQKF